ncbi:MAG: hypothetical protein ACJAYU_001320 [Bradymonadia bacterium]|jgi:hypothetical protein
MLLALVPRSTPRGGLSAESLSTKESDGVHFPHRQVMSFHDGKTCAPAEEDGGQVIT